MGISSVGEKEFSCFKSVFLYGVMESSLALNVLSVHPGTGSQEELAELHTLDAVDETGAAVKIWFLDVGIVVHQQLDDVQMGHEAGGPHRGGAGVRHAVDVGAVADQDVDDAVLAGDTGAPERRHVVNRSEINFCQQNIRDGLTSPVVLHLIQSSLLQVSLASAN